ncbi:MAG: rRNA maturation RNase YbeY [Alphaproteobacteria bacterium]|nr:MAG: rRNA maturation RNase YbeY [Alphaproteobacteria bacterium]
MESVAENAARAALADNRFTAQGADFAGFEIAVALADDTLVRDLNARHRGRATATDVLSFPAVERPDAEWLVAAGGKGGEAMPLGDVIIARETAIRDARALGLPLAHHLAHLVIHGVLHCLGYDHRQDAEAEEMEALERRILARLGIPDPYATAAEASADGMNRKGMKG